MMRIELDRRWRVDLLAGFSLPIDAATVWRYMRDFQRFVCLDFFHQAVHLNGPVPRIGTHLRIEHRFVCFAVQRVGRILSWRDGCSYAFSDLSRRPGRGFPHVYVYEVQPEGDGGCRFNIVVRGKWTATWLPRPLVRLWLGWVMLKIRQSAHNELLFRAARESRFAPQPRS